MAATFESFSIREFVLKKRSVDLGTCWPFGEEALRKEGKESLDLLPPIVCRKFRWWSFENNNIKKPITGDEDEVDGSKSNTDVPENLLFPPKDLETLQSTVVLEKDSGFDGGNSKVVLLSGAAVLPGESGFEKEEGSVVKICPVCETFTSTTINAVNAHIDSCLTQASCGEKKHAKHKSRVPKKRSIVEIFAAAPHVETVEDEEEEEEEGDQEQGEEPEDEKKEEEEEEETQDNVERNGFNLDGCGDSSEQQQLEEGKPEKGKIFKARRKRKTKLYDEESLQIKRKEKLHRLKLPSPADLSLPRAKLQKKKLKKLIPDAGGGILAKKPSYTKKLPKQKQLKVMRSSKLVSKHPQGNPPVLPIHSILKNQTVYLQCDSLTRHCVPKAKQSGRHVRFSGKDDVFGSTKKFCSPAGLSQTETLRKVISDAMADLSVADRPCSAEANDTLRTPQAIDDARKTIESNDDVSVRVYRNTGKILNDNDLPSVISSNNRICNDIEKAARSEPMDLNQALQQFDNLHLLNPVSSIAAHNLSDLLNSFSKEGTNSEASSQAEGSVSRIPSMSKRLPASLGNPIARFSNMSPLLNLSRTTTMNHPIACIGTNIGSNVMPPYQLEPNKQSSSSCFLQYPVCPLPQKDTTASLHASLIEPRKQSTRRNGHFGESNISSSGIFSACTKISSRDKRIDEDFLGLPLNLSGKFGSNPRSSFPAYSLAGRKFSPGHLNTQEKAHNAKRAPNHSLRLFADQSYSKKNQMNKPVPSRLGFNKLVDIGRIDESRHDSMTEKKQQSVCHSDSEFSMVNIIGPGSQDYNQSQNIIRGNEKAQEEGILGFGYRHTTQPTVRLMGKNVMVGRSNNEEDQGIEEAKIWKDKEIIIENEPMTNQCFRQEQIAHPVSQASRDNGKNLVQVYSNPSLSKVLQFTSSEPGFAPTFLNSNTHLMSRNDLSLTDGRYGVSFSNLVYPLPSQTLPSNQKSKPVGSFISETELSQINHQNPITACTPLGACLQHDQNFAYRAKSSFQFPFSNHDCGEYIQSSWPKSPPSSLPQWLLNATQQKETQQSSQPSQACSDPIVGTNSFAIFQTNLLPSLPYLPSDLSFSAHKHNTSHPCLQNSSSVASLINPLLIPPFPRYRPTSTFNTINRNRNKPQEKRNAKFTQDHAKKVKKRPATKAEDSTKPIKRMRGEMHEKNSMIRTGSKKSEQLYGYTQYNAAASEIDKTSDVCFSAIDIGKNGPKAGVGVNCFKQDVLGRSGPIKLTAGARHILKPSQNPHQDNSRPIHSTIPFVVATASVKEPDLQKKTAKIYRF